ncbi:MAG TPA: DUF3426 domain-containing protein, partial [Opitutaceae bacterium]|nr:DUF3426 domain-containing protein [Opitutaceae bacterium]
GAAALEADDAPMPAFLLEEEVPSRGSTFVWALLAVLAAAALLAQTGYRYRTEIAVLVPGTRAILDSACRMVGCRVSLPRRPELMSIDSSDLQADTRSESLIALNALLRNRAPFQQEFPALELTLTDDADQPVLRRVLTPADYLDPARAALAPRGIPGGAEVSLRVNLDTGRTRATGYRLYLFYPQ